MKKSFSVVTVLLLGAMILLAACGNGKSSIDSKSSSDGDSKGTAINLKNLLFNSFHLKMLTH